MCSTSLLLLLLLFRALSLAAEAVCRARRPAGRWRYRRLVDEGRLDSNVVVVNVELGLAAPLCRIGHGCAAACDGHRIEIVREGCSGGWWMRAAHETLAAVVVTH